jgi:hypothetical protein
LSPEALIPGNERRVHNGFFEAAHKHTGVESMFSRSTKVKESVMKTAFSIVGAFALIPFFQATALAGRPTQPTTPAATPLTRTYVSGLGSDNNPCTVSSPCASLQAALALTIAGGEIFVLDSANYGPVTINKAVSITAEGAGAGILVASGTGIAINAGASDVINLRGLVVDGAQTGATGIQFNSGGSLIIQNAIVRNFAGSGINFAPNGAAQLFVTDTTVSANKNNGILIAPANSSGVAGMLARVAASGNGVGIFASGGNVSLTMTDTVAGNNTYGVGAASSSAVMVRNSTFSNNMVGVAADQSALIRVGQSTLTANGTGWSSQNGAQLESYGNNNLNGNTADGTPTNMLALQ